MTADQTSAVLGAMIATVGMWIGLGLIFAGIGLSLRRAFGLRLHSADDWLAALCLPLIAGFRWTGPGADGGFHPLPPADVQMFTTTSGLVVYTPRAGDQCWDAPLPCTPYPDAALCLRQAQMLPYGFMRCPGER